MMYKVSVIVPVYRVEQQLLRCLESLRMQTLQGIEVLLVDDHGGDNSMSIARQYIVIHQLESAWNLLQTPQNSGPGMARNVGIAAAQGEYVAFCDADDWVEPTMYETLYLQAQEHNADISSSAAMLDFPNGDHQIMTNPQVPAGKLSVKNRKYILARYVSNFTTMLFRRDWLLSNQLCFPNSRSGEDSCFIGCCYLLCSSIAQCNEPFYHYVIYPTSISHQRGIYRGPQKRKAFKELLQFARSHGLWAEYKHTLRWVYFKKAIVTSILDYLKSL